MRGPYRPIDGIYLRRLLALVALELAVGLNQRLLQSLGLVDHRRQRGPIQLGRSLGALQSRRQLCHALFDAGNVELKTEKWT